MDGNASLAVDMLGSAKREQSYSEAANDPAKVGRDHWGIRCSHTVVRPANPVALENDRGAKCPNYVVKRLFGGARLASTMLGIGARKERLPLDLKYRSGSSKAPVRSRGGL